MKWIKNLMVAALLAIAAIGCAFGPNGEKVIVPVAQEGISAGAALTVYLAVRNNPESAPYLQTAAGVLKSVSDIEETLSPADVEASLRRSGALKDDVAKVVSLGIVKVYRGLVEDPVSGELAKVPIAKQILRALSQGITDGLSLLIFPEPPPLPGG